MRELLKLLKQGTSSTSYHVHSGRDSQPIPDSLLRGGRHVQVDPIFDARPGSVVEQQSLPFHKYKGAGRPGVRISLQRSKPLAVSPQSTTLIIGIQACLGPSQLLSGDSARGDRSPMPYVSA